jgi:hypothetical protein
VARSTNPGRLSIPGCERPTCRCTSKARCTGLSNQQPLAREFGSGKTDRMQNMLVLQRFHVPDSTPGIRDANGYEGICRRFRHFRRKVPLTRGGGSRRRNSNGFRSFKCSCPSRPRARAEMGEQQRRGEWEGGHCACLFPLRTGDPGPCRRRSAGRRRYHPAHRGRPTRGRDLLMSVAGRSRRDVPKAFTHGDDLDAAVTRAGSREGRRALN